MPGVRVYENPLKTIENRLPSRSYYIPQGISEYKLLNGDWDFAYFERDIDVPEFMAENGNVYNQGSNGYLLRALARAGRGNDLYDVMKWMLPCYEEKHPTYAAMTAPYAVINCYQELPVFKHRGMLSFLTGTVAMCLRGAYEWLVGFESVVGGLELSPCIPDDWDKVSLSLSYKGKVLNIQIERTGREKLTVNDLEVAKLLPNHNRYNGYYRIDDDMLKTGSNTITITI